MTVSISVNGGVIYSRTVRRIIDTNDQSHKRCYAIDDGTGIWHDPKDGIVDLAIKALKDIDDVAKPSLKVENLG